MPESLSLQGKTAVITGATAGIGLSSLIALAQAGASVIGVGRGEQRCKQAAAFVRQACPGAEVQYLLADLSLQSQVRLLAGEIEKALKNKGKIALDVLVNNAGLYSQKMVRTAEGIELTLAVNHLAVFLLTHELLPLLKNAADGRVITVSSNLHRRARMNLQRLNHPRFYFGLSAYALSKLGNVLFTSEFNRRYTDISVKAFAVDPGLVNTDIALKQSGALSRVVWKNRARKGAHPEVPARTILFLSENPGVRERPEIYWRDCQPKAPSSEALREDLAQELWEKSQILCHLKRT